MHRAQVLWLSRQLEALLPLPPPPPPLLLLS
jgi:hypothetical protein